MIFARGILAGVAALVVTVVIIYALAVGVPRILDLIPHSDGGVFVYSIGPFPRWPLVVAALFIFCAGFYWSFRRARRHR